jgi:hypothetical protein
VKCRDRKLALTNSPTQCLERHITYVILVDMGRGESGRIVIEVEPEMKRRLYSALALTGSTLKDWFVKAAADFCVEALQPSLFNSTSGKSQTEKPRPD